MTDTVITLDSIETRDGIQQATLYVTGHRDRVVIRVGDTLTLKWPMDESIGNFIRELERIRAADGDAAP